ncbi:hypothetical protein JHN59_25015 [Streptomyces sp. MBT49]|uniref:hypothetical protein n=1 Tax=unclassified Streptomyces TaxID=2593676 RepID=UPI00190992AD|nr:MULTISPECIES: hypothetical protein [unclassified Streptomyces]MBK3628044.1 hypothetical protein [Streptomyces sp. MBT49]MBK3634289.1 hypothetical protein [Streptomyces sp. MBT97]
MPERFDDIPDLTYTAQPVNMAHVAHERTRIDELEQELKQKSDPTYRAAFEAPDLPNGYTEHETDDAAVKAAGKELVSRLEYVERNRSEWEIQNADFVAKVSRRKQDEADYQSRVTKAVVNGADIPDPVEHEDLGPVHRELNKLESAITVGARVAHESRAKLDTAYRDLFASDSYRAWADKERDKRWADVRKAVDLVDIALSAIESINSKLPHPYGDKYGTPYEAPVERVYGGLNGFAEQQEDHKPTIREAVSILQEHEPKAYKLSQLDEDDKAHYALRSAEAKMDREAEYLDEVDL